MYEVGECYVYEQCWWQYECECYQYFVVFDEFGFEVIEELYESDGQGGVEVYGVEVQCGDVELYSGELVQDVVEVVGGEVVVGCVVFDLVVEFEVEKKGEQYC